MDDAYLFISAGGALIVPLSICSIILVAIVFERILFLRTRNISSEDYEEKIISKIELALTTDNWSGLETSPTPISSKLSALAIESRALPIDQIQSRLEAEGRKIVFQLEKYSSTLAAISGVAPLMGLMGTVLGMVQTFHAIQEHGLGNVQFLAGGISEALISTLAGLTVGIPAFLAHHWQQSKVDQHVLGLEVFTVRLLELFARYNPQAPSSTKIDP